MEPQNPVRLLDAMFEQYQQEYFNAKNRGELTPRLYFKQANSKTIRAGKGQYGQGVYALGQLIDRNKDNPPDAPHSTDAELVLNDRTLLEKYGTTDFSEVMGQAKADNYVGFQYDDDKYFLFADTVITKNLDKVARGEGDAELSTDTMTVKKNEGNGFLAKNELTGETDKIYKRSNRWFIEGQKGTYRSARAAVKELEDGQSFANLLIKA